MTNLDGFSVSQAPALLVVEDSDEDFETLKRFLKRSLLFVPIFRCISGDQALDFLYHTGKYSGVDVPRPGMIILDLNLPGKDGREVLYQIKQDSELKAIPVIVFTTSNNSKDIDICRRYGVNKYIVKPIDFAQLKRDIQMFVDYWFEVTAIPNYHKEL